MTHAKLESSKSRKTPMLGTMPTEIYKLLFRHVSDIGHFITELGMLHDLKFCLAAGHVRRKRAGH